MRLAYGFRTVPVPASIARRAGILRPPDPRATSPDPLREALAPISRWAAGGKRILIVLPDATRYAAAELALPRLRREFLREGIADSCVRLYFACGLHRPLDRGEALRVTGPEIARAWKPRSHRARGVCSPIGARNGIRIEIADELLQADRVLLLTAVGIHYLAGFGGGWKLLFPGCASEETILGLHRLTLGRGCEPGRLRGNPFRSAIDAAGRLFPVPAFALHVWIAPDRRLLAADAGPPEASFRRMVRRITPSLSLPPSAPADLVLLSAGGAPRDIDLIQSHKAIDQAARLLRPGGRMIVLAECPRGLGFPGFERWFRFPSPEALLKSLRRSFHAYGRTAWSLWSKARRYRITLVSGLPSSLVRALRLEPAHDLAGALRQLRPSGRIIILPSPSFLVRPAR